jgi:hypothetical protein
VVDMGRKIIVNEDKLFDACALVEEITEHLISNNWWQINTYLITGKASQASLLLNQTMKEGELVK